MIPVQDYPGHHWRTNDAADLRFTESGQEQPTHVDCYNLHDTLNRGEMVRVPAADLDLISRAYFGDRKAGWTGDAYRFGVYRWNVSIGRPQIVIIVSHGGGMEAYCLSDLVAFETWTHLSNNVSEEILWNLCYEIMHAQRAVKTEVHRAAMRLFLDGRLRKRKRGTWLHVEVLPPYHSAESTQSPKTVLSTPRVGGLYEST